MTFRIASLLVLVLMVLGCADDGATPEAASESEKGGGSAAVSDSTSAATPSADAVVMKFTYIPGKTYRAATTMTMSSSVTLGGEKIEQRMVAGTGVSLTCRAADDGEGKLVTLKYEEFSMTTEAGGQAIEMSTAGVNSDGSPNPMAAMLKPIIDSELTISMSADDEITEIRGLDALKQQFSSDPLLAPLVEQIFGEDQLRQLTNLWIKESLPKKPVGPGDEWPVDLSMPMSGVGTISLAGVYSLTGFEEVDGARCAIIAVDSTVTMEGAGGQFAELGMSLLEGTQTGTIWWDYDTGYMRKSKLAQVLTMSMKDPVTGQPTTMPLSMQVDSKVTID